jgi:lipopolysaccharide/colanic/teichoic acid biosynthesis glycosyltransferase
MVLSPLLVLIAAAVKLGDGGPVFYSHPRVGRNFRGFGLLKFRSMVVDADLRGGPLTAAGDPRVTHVGRWLRRTKLDELPQLVNVLRGEMQWVGARPESERYVRRFAAEYAELLQERPGITDPASLEYRDEETRLQTPEAEARYVTEILPDKLALSLEHARHRSFRRDLEILLRTLLGLRGPRRALGRAGLSEPA